MDNSTIALKPVKELLGMNFFIPDYQRGYRWTAQQALDLLNDIMSFATNTEKGETEIYCIQPLVVQRKEFAILEKIKTATSVSEVEKYLKGSWNVVDGQQRLTTIYIILSALGLNLPYEIDYQTRKQSKKFLENISEIEANENIDFYHIFLVHDTVRKWLSELEMSQKQVFQQHLLGKVNFIWYQIPDESAPDSRQEAIAAFTRLNIGKIPLTDSELIKALFLNRNNFNSSSIDIETQQRQIAIEWDKIEYTLQDDAFWLFLHDKGYDKPTRIDFILDMMCAQDIFNLKENPKRKGQKKQQEIIAANEKIEQEIGNDEHRTFRYFYYAFTHSTVSKEWLREKWDCIYKYFQIFNEWFHDYKLYHYIGYLTITSNDENLIQALVADWNKESKENFTETVKNKIFNILAKNNGFRDLDNFVYEEEYNGSTTSKRKCVPILLLHNIETIVQQNDKLVSDERYALPNFTKFPFHLYKSENWEVEHIRPNSGDKIQSEDARNVYAHLAKAYLPNIDGLHSKIDDFIDGNESFDDVLEKILEVDKSLPDSEKNKIWNYALLDGTTNKEYGNVIFPIKRAFLANKERGYKIIYKISDNKIDTSNRKDEIAFVPPCTRNVFAKFYTDIPNGMLEWTRLDATAYLKDIKEKLAYYINKLQYGGEN